MTSTMNNSIWDSVLTFADFMMDDLTMSGLYNVTNVVHIQYQLFLNCDMWDDTLLIMTRIGALFNTG